MSDQVAEPLTPAEARLAARMHRWSEHGVVPIDAADIARRAATAGPSATTRGPAAWPRAGSRRMVLILAALLLVGLAVALAAATLLRTPNPSDAYRAVVIRAVDRGVEVVVAAADGTERALRHVTPATLDIDPRYVLDASGSVDPRGWLELRANGSGDDRTGLARWGVIALVDLADPARKPLVLPAPGFTNGDWGPDGRYALFCTDSAEPSNCGQPLGSQPHQDMGAVRVLDLDAGGDSEIIVPSVQTFGGGPDIFWAADGSGFLAQRGTEWGVTPLDGGPFIPGLPKLLDRGQYTTTPGLDEQYATTLGLEVLAQYIDEDWHATEPETATSVAVQRSTDWAAVWQAMVDTHDTSPRAVLARRAGPGAVDSVHTFAVPEDLGWAIRAVDGQEGSFVIPWFTLAPDDTFVALHGANVDRDLFVLAPLTPRDQTAASGPVIEGLLAGLVPAAVADTWPGQ